MINFQVSVIGFNVDTFKEKYQQYIKKEHEMYFENTLFELEAPQDIYDEIDNLGEELIEIIKE
jgi:hypothetical protein